ncbi:hypothetical protein IDVR_19660 [Intrasporangium sp. DVR]
MHNAAATGPFLATLEPMGPLLRARILGQAGLLTRAQALTGGFTAEAIEWKLHRGQWVRVVPGVYLTTPGRDDWEMRAVAALLGAGSGAALFGRSAGHAWGLVKPEPQEIEVVIPAERRVRAPEGVVIRRSRTLTDRIHPTEWPHRVRAEHTVFDLAQGGTFDRAVALAAKAIGLELATPEGLRAALQQRRGQSHARELLDALADVADGAESPAELRYLRDVERAHALPMSRRQVPISGGGGRRDVEYEEWGLVVEIDGQLGHAAWTARQRDGRRDRKAAVAGKLTVRCHWSDLVPTGCELAADLGAILLARGWAGQLEACGEGCPAAGPGRAALAG